MAHLYKLSLTELASNHSSRVLALSWSRDNFLCVATASLKGDVLRSDLTSKLVCDVYIIDPNRPWMFHSVCTDRSDMVHTVEWSPDGKCVLIITERGSASVWSRKDNCLNTWEKVYKTEITGPIVTAKWINTFPQVTINHGKNNWEELFTKQQGSCDLLRVISNGITIVTADSKLLICTLQGKYSSTPLVVDLVSNVSGNSGISSADIITKNDGQLLCVLGHNDGTVKVFNIVPKVQRFGHLLLGCELTARMEHSDHVAVKQLKLVSSQSTGYSIHLLYGNSTLQQWVLGELTSTINTEPKLVATYPSSVPLTVFTLTNVCFGSCDTTSNHDDDVIVLDDDDMRGHKETQRLVELLLVANKYGSIKCLKRDSYAVMCDNFQTEDRLAPPAVKQMKMGSGDTVGQVLCLSPNGCCVVFGVDDHLFFFDCGRFITNKSNTDNLFLLFLLAIVCDRLPWDLAVSCALSSTTESSHVLGVLYQLSRNYQKQESHLQSRYLSQYCIAKSILHSCQDEGVQSAMTYHDVIRLQAVYNLLSLYMHNDSNNGNCCEMLKSTCEAHKAETSLQVIFQMLPVKELLSVPVIHQVQPHLLWTVDYTVRIASRLAKKDLQKVPDAPCLSVLRELLVVLHSVSSVIMLPQVHNINDLLGPLFKAVTLYCQSPAFISFPDSLLSELSDLPSETNSNQLTLSKAAFLQGFLCGLNAGVYLPQTYYKSSPPPIRLHVLKKQVIHDPYSPLALAVPTNLSPPWQDRLYEGQGDSLHFGSTIISKQTARQCSRCRYWASFSDAPESVMLAVAGTEPQIDIANTWDATWNRCCPCGGLWCQNFVE
ncbi:mediator of RNA polymerase II transcription subunit 16-like isoform X2 [Dysidea avara]|uniref:mediator of RNA polymerase II transcription subunit 16-like isoform X2 n=1 Tax=Dysidea avara TaxID=196820 RepID=UPI00332DEA20